MKNKIFREELDNNVHFRKFIRDATHQDRNDIAQVILSKFRGKRSREDAAMDEFDMDYANKRVGRSNTHIYR